MRKLGLFLILSVAACSDDAAPAVDAGEIDVESPDADLGDQNDSFAEAEPVPPTATGVTGQIDAPGDHDFYTLTATEGDFIAINTEANPDDDSSEVDTVIRLYDSSMTQVAENDDRVPRGDTDSEILYHVIASGTYYVEVLEYGEWIDGDDVAPRGNDTAAFRYVLTWGVVDDTQPVVTVDTGSHDTAATALPLDVNANGGFIFGTFDDENDVDVYSFTAPDAPNGAFNYIMPAGTDGYGSTTPAGRIRITDSTGVTVVARIDHAAGNDDITPPLTPGMTYLLWVEFPTGGSAGENDFYVIKHSIGMDNPPEAEPNNTSETATPVDLDANGQGFLLASLVPPATDVDYFAVAVPAGQSVAVFCGSESSGSSLTGVTAQLRNSSDVQVAEAAEDETGITIPLTSVPAGTAYVRLTATGQDPLVTSNFIRCGIIVRVP